MPISISQFIPPHLQYPLVIISLFPTYVALLLFLRTIFKTIWFGSHHFKNFPVLTLENKSLGSKAKVVPGQAGMDIVCQ